jgi:Taurine catabolism dioxygenase TauD, TfdA family
MHVTALPDDIEIRNLHTPQLRDRGYHGPVFKQAGSGRTSIRLRLDDLAWFSSDAASALPLLRAVIARHAQSVRLQLGEGLLLSNTRWLHGRDSYAGNRVMLRVLGDPLPSTGLLPGFTAPEPPPSAQTRQAA